jgi:chromosome segregation ATPase
VTKREQLDAALAQAEAARERLEAALAQAKAALVNTVTNASMIDANRDEASAKVEKARARCRQLRAALADPSHQEFITRSRERIGTLIKQSHERSEGGAATSPPSIQPREPAVRGEDKGSQDESRRRRLIHRFNNTLARSPHVRETIGLLALVLAYLQYYYFDVQLQILSLPSIVTLPFQ